MQAKTLAAVVVSAVIFAIAGWVVGSKSGTVSILKHSHDQKDCKGKECKVDIKVECSDPGHPTPASCEPYSDKAEVIEVDKDTKAINFEVKTSPFDFNQTDGIKFSSLEICRTGFEIALVQVGNWFVVFQHKQHVLVIHVHIFLVCI